jgi:hypothetical protein
MALAVLAGGSDGDGEVYLLRRDLAVLGYGLGRVRAWWDARTEERGMLGVSVAPWRPWPER